jgi:hypothetical protein
LHSEEVIDNSELFAFVLLIDLLLVSFLELVKPFEEGAVLPENDL